YKVTGVQTCALPIYGRTTARTGGENPQSRPGSLHNLGGKRSAPESGTYPESHKNHQNEPSRYLTRQRQRHTLPQPDTKLTTTNIQTTRRSRKRPSRSCTCREDGNGPHHSQRSRLGRDAWSCRENKRCIAFE